MNQMNRPCRRICVLMLAAANVALGACTRPVVSRSEDARPSYTATVPESVAVVKTAVLRVMEDQSLTRDTPFARFRAYPAGDPVFPPDFQLTAAEAAPEITSYRALAPAERANDLYLFDPIGTFWTSEYQSDGRPLPFHCHFIVHLGAPDPAHTEVRVLEHTPTVNAGRAFRMLGHEGPGRYDDLRSVLPTNREREALLRLILSQLKAAPAQ
jgi:hypothetical protein